MYEATARRLWALLCTKTGNGETVNLALSQSYTCASSVWLWQVLWFDPWPTWQSVIEQDTESQSLQMARPCMNERHIEKDFGKRALYKIAVHIICSHWHGKWEIINPSDEIIKNWFSGLHVELPRVSDWCHLNTINHEIFLSAYVTRNEEQGILTDWKVLSNTVRNNYKQQ